jgi:hypothetical protein
MSLLDLLAELNGLGKPDGEPVGLRGAAIHMAAAADGFDRTASGLDRITERARVAWTGQAAEAFSEVLVILRQQAAAAPMSFAGLPGRSTPTPRGWKPRRRGGCRPVMVRSPPGPSAPWNGSTPICAAQSPKPSRPTATPALRPDNSRLN